MSGLEHAVDVGVRLIGDLSVKLWGLPIREWQSRAWKKLGASQVDDHGQLLVGTDWVLSPALCKSLLAKPGSALIVKDETLGIEKVAAIHVPKQSDTKAFEEMVNQVDPDWTNIQSRGLTPGYMEDFVGEYDHALRKREAPYALSLFATTPHDIEKRLFKGSYKGVTDLVTKYVWPFPAFHVTRLCANLGITPNMVTTVSLALVCLAFYFFWIGAWVPGIIAGWAMTFLDTVDGKLARTTMTFSKWGNIYDHGIDLIHPPFWYWAMFVGLQQNGVKNSWLLPALWIILVGYVVGRITEGIFMRRYGFHIHVWERQDAIMREITARRNPNLLIFMVMVLFGAASTGFLLVAAWTVICTLFHLYRFILALGTKAAVQSYMDR